MLRNFARKPSAKSPGIMAFIDEGSEIEGKYTFSGPGTILLNGNLQGEITITDELIVGEKAVVNATIRAGSVVIWGKVVGDVHATERVELKGAARVVGALEAPVVVLDEGVFFEGRCRMTTTRDDQTEREPSIVRLKA
ncbi:MAG: polymer-forming cytoskeletal protein [Candidatus Methylomirabilales bacterium]